MPKGAKGQRRPAAAVGHALRALRTAAGAIDESLTEDGKSKAAVELGRRGGKARAEKLSTKRRLEIAKKAARARWG